MPRVESVILRNRFNSIIDTGQLKGHEINMICCDGLDRSLEASLTGDI